MFGPIGGYELLLILVLALLLFGPRKLPQIGRQVARALGELRSAATDFRSELEREVDLEELRKTRGELDDSVRSIARGTVSDGARADEGGDDDARRG